DVVGDPIDGGVVALAEAHEQIRMRMLLEPAQHVLEISRTHLGRSPRAGSVAGEANLLAGRGIGELAVGHCRFTVSTSRPDRREAAPAHTSASRKIRNASARGERLRSRWVARWNERVTWRSLIRRHQSRPLLHSSSTARFDITETPT